MVSLITDESLDESSQLSWPTPEFTHGNSGTVNSGMSLNKFSYYCKFKVYIKYKHAEDNFCSGLLVI